MKAQIFPHPTYNAYIAYNVSNYVIFLNLAELSSAGRDLISVCEKVHAKSTFIRLEGDDNKCVHVGSQADLWKKLQQCKVSRFYKRIS